MLKKISWMGSAKDDLKSMPLAVQKEIGFSLHQVQEGKTPLNSKSLTGIGNGVMEIISDHNKNTYRAVYVVKLGNDIYVLHSFQKKSKTGIKTPKKDTDLIKQRLVQAKKKALSRNK